MRDSSEHGRVARVGEVLGHELKQGLQPGRVPAPCRQRTQQVKPPNCASRPCPAHAQLQRQSGKHAGQLIMHQAPLLHMYSPGGSPQSTWQAHAHPRLPPVPHAAPAHRTEPPRSRGARAAGSHPAPPYTSAQLRVGCWWHAGHRLHFMHAALGLPHSHCCQGKTSGTPCARTQALTPSLHLTLLCSLGTGSAASQAWQLQCPQMAAPPVVTGASTAVHAKACPGSITQPQHLLTAVGPRCPPCQAHVQSTLIEQPSRRHVPQAGSVLSLAQVAVMQGPSVATQHSRKERQTATRFYF